VDFNKPPKRKRCITMIRTELTRKRGQKDLIKAVPRFKTVKGESMGKEIEQG
jgi:hypothetical protein